MSELIDINAVVTAIGASWNDMANALIVVMVLCVFAAVELFRVR